MAEKRHSYCFPEYFTGSHMAQRHLMVACGSLHPLSVASLSFYSYAFLFLTYSALGVALLIKWSRNECSKIKKQRNKVVSGQKPKIVKKKMFPWRIILIRCALLHAANYPDCRFLFQCRRQSSPSYCCRSLQPLTFPLLTCKDSTDSIQEWAFSDS